jgi:hypothetical protein
MWKKRHMLYLALFAFATISGCRGPRNSHPANLTLATSRKSSVNARSIQGNPAAEPPTDNAQVYAWSLFWDFVQQAENGLAGWQPRCQLIPGCGPGQHMLDFKFRSSAGPIPFVLKRSKLAAATQSVDPDSLTFYDPSAAQYVQQICVGASNPATCTSTVTFPTGSNIARTLWGVIPFNGPSTLGLYNSQITFDPDNPAITQADLFPATPIDKSGMKCPANLGGVTTIPLGCFHYVLLTTANLQMYRLENGGGDLKPGDVLVLLAVHLIRKELSGWTFSTFWWQSDIENAKYPCKAGSPPCQGVTSMWGHYAMDTVELPSDPGQTIGAVFNPYFEGGLFNNKETNCIVCHSFAANPLSPPSITKLVSPSFGGAGPITLGTYQETLNRFLQDSPRVETDKLWSIAQARDPSATSRNSKRQR